MHYASKKGLESRKIAHSGVFSPHYRGADGCVHGFVQTKSGRPFHSEPGTMAIDPEELIPRKKAPEIVIGQEISTLSVIELKKRISALQCEITRSEEALKARAATKNAAEAVFKR